MHYKYKKDIMAVSIGDIIKVNLPLDSNDEPSDMLCATPSTYGYGDKLQLYPRPDTPYVVCNGNPLDGFCVIQEDDPEAPIGFVILYVDDLPCYRITQVNHKPEPIAKLDIIGR